MMEWAMFEFLRRLAHTNKFADPHWIREFKDTGSFAQMDWFFYTWDLYIGKEESSCS